jgi:AbrB family looped-hinge helix DNA binding protein
MRHILASVTKRGQVTIPSEVRRLLGVGARQKIAFEIDGDQVRLVPAGPSLEEVFGAVSPRMQPEDFDQLSRDALDEKAERTAEELGGS